MIAAEHYQCTICGVDDLDGDQMVDHFETTHPFLSALVRHYSQFDDSDRAMAWLN